MIVLGIDPGMAETGYGVIAVEGSRMRAHAGRPARRSARPGSTRQGIRRPR